MKRTWGLSLAFCLMLLDCGGGGSSTPPPAPAPAGPVAMQLSASYDPAKAEVTLTWFLPAGTADGYNLEARINQGGYSQVNQTLIPGNTTIATLTFTSTPTELTTLDFRIYAVKNSIRGPYSNVAGVQIPLAPPTNLRASFSSADGGVAVSWSTPSLAADRYLLERATCNLAGLPTGPWIALPLPAPLVSGFVDKDVVETLGYIYHVTAWAGNVASTTEGPTPRVSIAPLAPSSFAAQPLPNAVGLAWVNRSQTATQIQITRAPIGFGNAAVVATLPASATSYQDNNLALGYYIYGINVSDGVQWTAGPTLTSAPANAPGSPILTATPLPPLPQLDTAALSPGGLWAFGWSSPFTVFPAAWGNWTTWSPSGVYAQQDGFLKLDAQSLPHTVYQDQSSTSASLAHAWFEGTAWKTEAVLPLPANYGSLASGFCLDRTGTPHILQDTGTGANIASLVYLHKVAGAWVQESLEPAGSWDPFSGTPRLFLDPSDVPHVLIPTWLNTREFSRGADGTWSSQTLTNTAPFGGGYYFEDGVWADKDTAWAFYQVLDATLLNDAFWVVQKVNGIWQPPVLLKTFTHLGTARASVALSPDGSRVAAVCYTNLGLSLFTRTSQGWAESLLPITAMNYPYVKAGFDGANRLHIVVKPSAYTADIVELHE